MPVSTVPDRSQKGRNLFSAGACVVLGGLCCRMLHQPGQRFSLSGRISRLAPEVCDKGGFTTTSPIENSQSELPKLWGLV
jgi:hypothetical protein